jgi:multidrug resistance protein MdtO
MPADAGKGWALLLRRELAVDASRWGRMLRMTACATIVVTLFLVFRVPLPAYGAYVVLMGSQRDMASSVTTSVGAFVAGAVAIGASLLLYIIDIDEPALRVPAMAMAMLTAMYASRLPRVGPIFFLAGFLLVVTQTLIDQVPDAESLTHLLLWLLLVLASACALVPLMESLFGQSSAEVFEDGMDEREVRIAALLGLRPARAPTIEVRELDTVARRLGAEAVLRLARVLTVEQAATLRARLVPDSDDAARIHRRLATMIDHLSGPAVHAPPLPGGIATPGPQAVRFALKATLAAMTCYIVYSALDWSGIRTAIITCFFVALASTGETVHKLGLRIAGALVGGTLAGLSIVFLFPVMDSIGGFVVLFAVVTLGCTWVATSSPLLAYAGLQTAFAFFLGVLQDSGPTDDLTVLRDRLAGILLGNVAMSVVFSVVWPVSTASSMRTLMAQVLSRQARLCEAPLTPAPADVISGAAQLDDIRRLGVLSAFDADKGAPSRAALRASMPVLADVLAWTAVLQNDDMAAPTRAWLAARLYLIAGRYGTNAAGASATAGGGPPPAELPHDLLHALDVLEGKPHHAP